MDLPADVLDDVVQRVPPRHLAACRRVRKNWRDVIDGRGLILRHLAPRLPRGIFINYPGNDRHIFFARPAPTNPFVGSPLRFLPHRRFSYSAVLDHCNCLLLYENGGTTYVCNPATGRWATLPPLPHVRPMLRRRLYLIFDPTASLHYEVLYFPDVPDEPEPQTQPVKIRGKASRKLYNGNAICADTENMVLSSRANYEHEVNSIGSMEWPPQSYSVQLFSSRTGQWKEKCFMREGDAVVTVSDVWSDPCSFRCYSVYRRREFFLHCRGGYVMRFSLLEDKYVAIKAPRQPRLYTNEYGVHIESYEYLGKSKQGVYYCALQWYQFSVWLLQEALEARGTPEWELKHQADLKSTFQKHYSWCHTQEHIDKSWILDPHEEESNDKGDHGWNSDDDSIVDADERFVDDSIGYRNCYYGVDFLGFHPCKDIAFLGSRYNGFAYYLGSSKLQYLGSLFPSGAARLHQPHAAPTLESFVYTPCIDDLLPAHIEP